MLYAAYGSNLNRLQMESRCPRSEVIGAQFLKNWKLCFRGVADIIPDTDSRVSIGLYKITEDCENALDFYEDFPNLYRKEYLIINEISEPILTYVMNSGYGFGPPSTLYFDTIKKGYLDWALDVEALLAAAKDSILKKGEFPYKSSRWNNNDFISFKFLDEA